MAEGCFNIIWLFDLCGDFCGEILYMLETQTKVFSFPIKEKFA